MKTFNKFLQEQLLLEAPPTPLGDTGGISSPGSLPGGPAGPGGPPGGGLPPVGGGGMPPMGGGGGMPPMGGGLPPMGGGGPAPANTQPVMKIKAPDVWSVLEKILG